MKKILATILTITFAITTFGIGATFGFTNEVTYASPADQINSGIAATSDDPNATSTNLTSKIPNWINIMLFIVGMASVIMIIYGGIRYTVSAGNESSVKTAKNIILYAIVGLVISILAYALVNFVITNLAK